MKRKKLSLLLSGVTLFLYSSFGFGENDNLSNSRGDSNPMNFESSYEKLEKKLTEFILACVEKSGEKSGVKYINAPLKENKHPQTYNLKICERYAIPIEKIDVNEGFVRDLSDSEQKKEYDVHKELEELYEKIYLFIENNQSLKERFPDAKRPYDLYVSFLRTIDPDAISEEEITKKYADYLLNRYKDINWEE